jgi:hypothetical protein
MVSGTIHNPDRYMVDLRQILSQGRKRIGLLLGAGAPASIRVDAAGKIDPNGEPLIPEVSRLTNAVVGALTDRNAAVVQAITADLLAKLHSPPNIEAILSRIRLLSQAVGSETVHGMDAAGFEGLGKAVARLIGLRVDARLPNEPNPFSELVAWIGWPKRRHLVRGILEREPR